LERARIKTQSLKNAFGTKAEIELKLVAIGNKNPHIKIIIKITIVTVD
jgi:hypothetical protein